MKSLAVAFALLPVMCFGEDDPDKGWREFCTLTAKNVTVREIGDNSKNPELVLHEHPIFEHKNPFSRDERGLVFLWKQRDGRPAAVFSSMIIRRRDNAEQWNEIFEYHSLHDKPLQGWFGEKKDVRSTPYRKAYMWEPKAPGLKWREIPDGPSPAKTKIKINRQARELVARFRCEGRFGFEERLYHLRPLSRPAYDYQVKDRTTVAGGILTLFCRATDPEAILSLEIRETESGYAWHYACANFTRAGIRFFLDDEKVFDEQSYQYPGLFFNPENNHYGNFPAQRFTIDEGIKRQRDVLGNEEPAAAD